MKSNINIASNVYVRNGNSMSTDEAFLKQVRGRKALYNLVPANAPTTMLTKTQITQRDMPTHCKHKSNSNNEQTHGLILSNGNYEWACRCEHTDCEEYNSCMQNQFSKTYNRTPFEKEDITPLEVKPNLAFKYLGVVYNSDVLDTPDDATDMEDIFEIDDTPILENTIETDDYNYDTTTLTQLSDEFVQITDQSVIIESDFNEHILVNAGPGTGKTYTVIKRLEYIISNNMINDYECVAVLCYTKTASKVIKARLLEKIVAGELPPEAKNIYICTIDSFATAYLSAVEDTKYNKMNYNQRIEHFIKTATKENLNIFEYFIIDELQDIVNHRATMVINILNSIDCGYLLLGDKCQAIYDYSANDLSNYAMNSVEFYEKLYGSLSNNVKKYELTINWRQKNNSFLNLTTNTRKSLLDGDMTLMKYAINQELKNIPTESLTVEEFRPIVEKDSKTAVLCRTNGEVEWVSSTLRNNNIPHTTTRENEQLHFDKSIAIILWDYDDDLINKDIFVMRYLDRIKDDEVLAIELFDALLEFSKTKETFLSKEELLQAMHSATAIPEILSSNNNFNLVVSTVHKAKGQEFDIVYYNMHTFSKYIKDDTNKKSKAKKKKTVFTDKEIFEETRIFYVAATRCRNDFKLIKFKSPLKLVNNIKDSSRIANLNWSYNTCKGVSIGNDIANESTIMGDYYTVISAQDYINTKIKINDRVELILQKGKYIVKHVNNSKYYSLGYLTDEATEDIRATINHRKNSFNLPNRIYDIYVSDIITIPQHIISDSVPVQLKKSKLSLGICISGLSRLDWRYGR